MPAIDNSVRDVWIGAGEVLGNGRRITPEEDDRAVDRIGQCASQNKFAAVACSPRQLEMSASECRPARNVIFAKLVEEQVMHEQCNPFLEFRGLMSNVPKFNAMEAPEQTNLGYLFVRPSTIDLTPFRSIRLYETTALVL
jgi:hypothetical protein